MVDAYSLIVNYIEIIIFYCSARYIFYHHSSNTTRGDHKVAEMIG